MDLSEHVDPSPVTIKAQMAPTMSIKMMYYNEKNETHHVGVLLSENLNLSENAELDGGGGSARPEGGGGGGTRRV